jgi:ferredoxin--NADP+ reductase
MASGLCVAVIGAGPSGLYAAEALARTGAARVDVFDRLPTPYGLVRYGVAPDHERIKSITKTLARVFDNDAVRFIGNVELGRDVLLDDLRTRYDAVIHATGASLDRRLGIAGEDLRGSFSATEFVSWYSGHPDVPVNNFALSATAAVVIGAGNVAIDVARILLKRSDELAWTDLPEHVLKTLASSRIQDVYLLARRGPVHAKFTTKELRELGEISAADVLVRPADLELSERDQAAVAATPALRRNIDVLTDWSTREPRDRDRRLHLRFWTRPERLVGAGAVEAAETRRTKIVDGELRDSGESETVSAELVLRSVGYLGKRTAGLPFDPASGTIPNDEGRVVDVDGTRVPGQYVTGWIKRGPHGVIGTNRSDSQQTVASLLADFAEQRANGRKLSGVDDLLAARGLKAVSWAGWCKIDRAEEALGAPEQRARVKISDRGTMLSHALS